MRKLLIALLLLTVFAACSRDRPLSKAAYTQEFAARLQKAAPDLQVTVKTEMELKVTTPDGHETTAYLDNSYTQYSTATPADRDATYTQYIDGIIETHRTVGKDTPLDPSTITAVVKDRAWVTEIIESSRLQQKATKPIELVYEPLNPELVIVYAEDSSKNLSYLTPDKLAKAGLKREDLRKLAVENLKRLLTKVEAKGANGVYMMTAGGTYEASLLLFEDIWQEKKLKVEGDYVVAVPARDLLLITGSGNKAGTKKIRELAQATVAEASYHLTADLFVYRDGHFVRFDE